MIEIPFSSNTDCTCWYEDVKTVPNNSFVLKYLVGVLVLSFKSILVLGPLKNSICSVSSVVNWILTWNEIGSDISSTTHKVSLRTYSAGRGSYSFTNMLACDVSSVSNKVFTAIKVLLSPKFKSKSE